MRIGVDLDEVVADSLSGVIEFHNKRHGTALTRDDFHSYNFWEVWGGTREGATKEVFEFFATDHREHIPMVAGSLKAMTMLKNGGHELYVITARADVLIKRTEEWIEHLFPQVFSGVHFTNAYSLSGQREKNPRYVRNWE